MKVSGVTVVSWTAPAPSMGVSLECTAAITVGSSAVRRSQVLFLESDTEQSVEIWKAVTFSFRHSLGNSQNFLPHSRRGTLGFRGDGPIAEDAGLSSGLRPLFVSGQE